MLDFLRSVVGVAKWLRRQVVALEIEGSNPSAHPTPSKTKHVIAHPQPTATP